MPAQCTVQVWRRGDTAPLKTLRVEIPTKDETTDAARDAVRSAVAQFFKGNASDVSVNHRVPSGFLCYVPSPKGGR